MLVNSQTKSYQILYNLIKSLLYLYVNALFFITKILYPINLLDYSIFPTFSAY